MPDSVQLLRDRAYRLILDMIFSGELTSGEPLSERTLAKKLDMGRTPVREALRALARDGVVEAQLSRGTFVRQLSVDDLREVYQVRLALEGMAASLAAQNGATKKMSVLGTQMRHMWEHQEDYPGTEIDDMGAEFHLEIFVAARNKMLLNVFEPLRLRFQIAFGLPRHHDIAALRVSLTEHLAIFDAIENRDNLQAQQAMAEHLAHGLEVRTRIFQNIQKDHVILSASASASARGAVLQLYGAGQA